MRWPLHPSVFYVALFEIRDGGRASPASLKNLSVLLSAPEQGRMEKKREKMANRASFIGVSAEHLRHHRNPFVFPAQRNRRWQRNKTGAGRKKAETTAKFRIIFFFFYGDGLGRSDRLNLTHLRPSATVPAEKQISKNYYLDSQNCNDFFLNFKASWGILKRISLLR